MRFTTRLRSSFAVKASPFVLVLSLFFYLGDAGPPSRSYGHAPTIVSYPLSFLSPYAYAAASALGAWEAGTIRKFHIWQLASSRSKYRIAAGWLAPVVAVSWAMLILPISLGFLETSASPTPRSLGPLLGAMLLCLAHAVIGFGVGVHLPRAIAAPVLAVTVWILISFTVSLDPPWLRQISGHTFEFLVFGEALKFSALWPPVVLTGGIAVAVALLWTRRLTIAVPVALAVLATSAYSSYSEVKDRGYFPPMATGVTDMTCTGTAGAPRICMPEVTASALPRIQRASASVLEDLRNAGVSRSPVLLIDTLQDGRYSRPSTAEVWRVPLTYAAEHDVERFQIVVAATGFGCPAPDPTLRRAALEWAAHVTHSQDAWRQYKERADRRGSTASSSADTMVRRVLRKPQAEQAAWFDDIVTRACRR